MRLSYEIIEKSEDLDKVVLAGIHTRGIPIAEIIRNIAGDVHREISELNPIVDARLADGSRVNSVYRNVAINGPILTIRKFWTLWNMLTKTRIILN